MYNRGTLNQLVIFYNNKHLPWENMGGLIFIFQSIYLLLFY